MTSTTQSVTRAPSHSPQWQRTAGTLLRINLMRAAWFFALALVGITAILLTISRFAEPQMSAVQFAYHAMLWYQFAMMVTVFVGYATVHVAHGMTRRSFIRGSLLAAGGIALGYALVITLMLLVERWLYARLGWYHGLSNIDAEVLDRGLWPYAWGAVLVFVVGNLSALLVAAAYYRFGGWWGTVLLPLTLAPLLLVSVFAMDHEIQWTPWDLTADVLGAARPVLAMVVIAGGVLAYHLLVRRMPISTHRP